MLKPVLYLSFFAASIAGCSTDSSTDTTSGSGAGSPSGGNGGGEVAHTTSLRGHILKGSGSDAPNFGGPNAVQSAKNVSALSIDSDGKTSSVAMSTVASDGTYSIDVPSDNGITVLEALDSKGSVLVRAIVDDALVEGKTLTVQPMTTESSVEAAVLLEMAAQGMAVADIDTVSLRAAIDSATATVVQGHAADTVSEGTADVQALAMAVTAAEASQKAALEQAGVKWTSFLAGELTASDTLTAALNKNANAAAQANTAFMTQLASLQGKLGMDAAASASAATDISASARTALSAESQSADLMSAFARTEAMVESAAAAAAMTEAFTKAAASASVMEGLQAANTALVNRVNAATTMTDLSAAFDTWRVALRGTATDVGGLLAKLLGGTVTASAPYTTTVTAIMSLDAGLQTAIDGAIAASEKAGSVDEATLASLIAQAYTSFDASVQAKMTASTLMLAAKDTALMTSVFIGADGVFQVNAQ